VISSLRGRCPKPLDECATYFMAGEEGFEPSLTDPESAVLPLDDSPAHVDYSIGPGLRAITEPFDTAPLNIYAKAKRKD
jgi:hypothetical protein